MVERNEISRQEVEVFRVLSAHASQWMTNADIAAECDRVAARTVRAVTQKLVHLGILDLAEVFPGHRFRLSEKAAKRNRGYADRLRRVAEVFGIVVGEQK
jgi:hypothetical protein